MVWVTAFDAAANKEKSRRSEGDEHAGTPELLAMMARWLLLPGGSIKHAINPG
jgi:hypothetical protein